MRRARGSSPGANGALNLWASPGISFARGDALLLKGRRILNLASDEFYPLNVNRAHTRKLKGPARGFTFPGRLRRRGRRAAPDVVDVNRLHVTTS